MNIKKVIVVERLKDGVKAIVYNENKQYDLNPCFHLRNHSPTGFEFGYGGSGPAQLALAILSEMCGEEVAINLYQDFKWDFLSVLSINKFTIDEAYVKNWVNNKNQSTNELEHLYGVWRNIEMTLEKTDNTNNTNQ